MEAIVSATDIRLEELKKLYLSIKREVEALNTGTCEIYEKYLQQLEAVRDRKIASISKWKQNEVESANMYYQGQLYGIENDYQNKYEEIQDRIQQFTQFKYQKLNKVLNNSADYFASQGYQFALNETPQFPSFISENLEISNDISLHLSDEEIREDVAKSLECQHNIEQGLTAIPNLKINKEVTIEMPFCPPITGVVVEIHEDYFVIQDDENQHNLSMSIFRSKYATIH